MNEETPIGELIKDLLRTKLTQVNCCNNCKHLGHEGSYDDIHVVCKKHGLSAETSEYNFDVDLICDQHEYEGIIRP